MSTCYIYNLDERNFKRLRSIMLRVDYNLVRNADGTYTVSFNVGTKYSLSVLHDGVAVTTHLTDGDYSVLIKRSRYSFIQIS